MNRRKFLKTTAAVAASAILPLPAFATKKTTDYEIANWLHRHRLGRGGEVLGSIPPIRVYCLGSDDDPATSEDMAQAMAWIERQNSSLPENTTAVSSITPVHHDNSIYGRIGINRCKLRCGVPCPSMVPDSIQCRYYVVKRPGNGYLEVKIGSDNRPPCQSDLEDIREQLIKALKEQEITIVTHHLFDMTWMPVTHGYAPYPYDAAVIPHDFYTRQIPPGGGSYVHTTKKRIHLAVHKWRDRPFLCVNGVRQRQLTD